MIVTTQTWNLVCLNQSLWVGITGKIDKNRSTLKLGIWFKNYLSLIISLKIMIL